LDQWEGRRNKRRYSRLGRSRKLSVHVRGALRSEPALAAKTAADRGFGGERVWPAINRNNALNNHSPRQFKLFADGARPVAARKRPQAPQPNEANLQAKLDAARKRLHEIVILRFGCTSTC
jgi:hypothetical protein